MKNFYKRFRIITKLPFWRPYLKKVFALSQKDANTMNIKNISERKKFTSLLCGVSGEITADEYLKFILKINKDAEIIIIDLGDEQIASVKKLIKNRYQNANITVKQCNALNLSFIKNNSVDWIDTDGFFSFFDEKMLLELFLEWKRILKKEGYITFRELISKDIITRVANDFRDFISRLSINTKLYKHSFDGLTKVFDKANFQYSTGKSPIPLLDRYCIKNR